MVVEDDTKVKYANNKNIVKICMLIVVVIIGLTSMGSIKGVDAVDTVTPVSYTTKPSSDAYNYGVWSNYVGGTRVAGLADYANQTIEITKEAMTSGGKWVEFKVNGKVIGWVGINGIDAMKIEVVYPATTRDDSYNYGVWSDYIGGTRVNGLSSYDNQQLQIRKEATVSGSVWVEFAVDGKVVGWVNKAGINEGDTISKDMGLKGEVSTEEDAIKLEWDSPDKKEAYTYQIYSKKPKDTDFQTISSSNLDTDKVVKALNVFPVNYNDMAGSNYIPVKVSGELDIAGKPLHNSAMLEEWIGEYGHGKIDVESVNQNDFDDNPDKWLKDDNGKYKYDVIAVGFWNINAGQNSYLGANGVEALRSFAEAGGGLLTGHHHIGLRELDRGMNNLRDLFGIKLVGETGWNQFKDTYVDAPVELDYTTDRKSVSPHNSVYWATGDEVVATKRGLLLEYPNYVAEEGRIFDIPLTHNGGDYVTGDVWLEFTSGDSYRSGHSLEDPEQLPDGSRGTTNSYLSTFNNTAFIQAGHSSLSGGVLYSTEDEKKLIANTIFYLAQLTTDTSLVDRSAMESYPPEFKSKEVNVSRVGSNINLTLPEATDVESTFEYYVEATGQNTGTKYKSDEIKVSNTSGLAGYSYVIDDKPETLPDNKVDTTTTSITTPKETGTPKYLHVVAVDKKGNMSEPIHMKLDNKSPVVTGVSNNSDVWTGSSITLYLTARDGESGVSHIIAPDGSVRYNGDSTYTVNDNGEHTFIIVDNAGNKTEHKVNVTKIDKTKPDMVLEYTPKGWTKGNIAITAKGVDKESGIKNVRMSTEENSKNLVSMADIKAWHGKDVERVPKGLRLKSSNDTYYGGFYIPDTLIKANENYVLSFDMQKISGNIPIIGGHSHNSTVTKVLIDGEEAELYGNQTGETTWGSGVEYPNDTKKHHITVFYHTGNYDKVGDKNLYVQPNRLRYTEHKDYDVLFENIQFEQGDVESEYETNYKDQLEDKGDLTISVSDNGTYKFTATDNVGNETVQTLDITTIDKTPPTLTITGNPTDYTDKDEIVLAINGKDTQSGVKSIKTPDGKVHTGGVVNYTITSNGKYDFVIEDNVGNTYTHTETVDKMMIPYTFYLLDANGNPVKGAGFDLMRNGVKYASAVSNDEGLVNFGKVPEDGRYTIKQTKAPDGYVVNPDEKEVEVGDTTEPEEFVTYPRGSVLPGTGTSDLVVIGTWVGLTIIGYVVTRNKREKAEENK